MGLLKTKVAVTSVVVGLALLAAPSPRAFAQASPDPFSDGATKKAAGTVTVTWTPEVEAAEGPVSGAFVCEGEVAFPDESLINVGLKRAGMDEYIGDAWGRCKLVEGKWQIKLGPFDGRKVLRGEYVVDAWLYVDRQPKFVYEELRRQYRLAKDHRELVATKLIRIGDADQEQSDTVESNGSLKEIFAVLRGLNERITAKVEAPPPAPADADRKTFRKGCLKELAGARKELIRWYRSYIGVPAEEHVAIVETLISAINEVLKIWVTDPTDANLGQMSHQANKMIENFEAVPLPGENLIEPGDDGDGSGAGE